MDNIYMYKEKPLKEISQMVSTLIRGPLFLILNIQELTENALMKTLY